LRFLDVVAFRAYARLALAPADRAWKERALARVKRDYPAALEQVPRVIVSDPNSPEAKGFLEQVRPDIAIARCKVILKREVYELPRLGTFVLHPGICPEYRNAHGCFWALANRDTEKVGMTLLQIDAGVDTGPVYGYFSYPYDERAESHVVIQKRVVFDNLDALRDKLLGIGRGEAAPVDTTGRHSAAWGQPWLTAYLRWKRAAKGRH
jgi:methionyl-tRNA formyltransferase